MPSQKFLTRILFSFVMICTCPAQTPAPRLIDLTVPDGTMLKASYFAGAKTGPGILLLHQCDQERKIWDGLPQRLAARGFHVLTVDNRGFGESGGTRFDKLTQEEKRKVGVERWPGDFDVAFQYLSAQPGVTREVMGAGGASCGVNNSIQLARRHPEVKALMLLAGPTDRDGRLFLQSSKGLPVFVAAADDDQYGNLTEIMQWLFSVSVNSGSRFQRYATGRHGAEMFAPHPELMDLIADWFAATLMNKAGNLPQTNGSRFERSVAHNLDLMDKASGTSEVAKNLAGHDPRTMFPESIVNLLGYEHLQIGDSKGAVEIMKLNASAYPDSANAYDSLADAYLADGQKELAVQNAKKALELLANDTKDSEGRRKGIRESAEQKLK